MISSLQALAPGNGEAPRQGVSQSTQNSVWNNFPTATGPAPPTISTGTNGGSLPVPPAEQTSFTLTFPDTDSSNKKRKLLPSEDIERLRDSFPKLGESSETREKIFQWSKLDEFFGSQTSPKKKKRTTPIIQQEIKFKVNYIDPPTINDSRTFEGGLAVATITPMKFTLDESDTEPEAPTDQSLPDPNLELNRFVDFSNLDSQILELDFYPKPVEKPKQTPEVIPPAPSVTPAPQPPIPPPIEDDDDEDDDSDIAWDDDEDDINPITAQAKATAIIKEPSRDLMIPVPDETFTFRQALQRPKRAPIPASFKDEILTAVYHDIGADIRGDKLLGIESCFVREFEFDISDTDSSDSFGDIGSSLTDQYLSETEEGPKAEDGRPRFAQLVMNPSYQKMLHNQSNTSVDFPPVAESRDIISPDGTKIKRRKTKEEKIRAKEERMDRLRSMGLLSENKTNILASLQADIDQQSSPIRFNKEFNNIKLGNFKTHLSTQDSVHFHQPNHQNWAKVPLELVTQRSLTKSARNTGAIENKLDVLVNRKDLTAKTAPGDIVITEFLEKNPPLILNTGMHSKLKNGELSNELYVTHAVPYKSKNLYVIGKFKKKKVEQTNQTRVMIKLKGQKNAFIRKVKQDVVLVSQIRANNKVRAFNPTQVNSKQKELQIFLDTFVLYHLIRQQQRLGKSKLSFSEARAMFPVALVPDPLLRRLHSDILKSELAGSDKDLIRKLRNEIEENLPVLCGYEAGQAYWNQLFDQGIVVTNSLKADMKRLHLTAQIFFKVNDVIQSINNRFSTLNNYKCIEDKILEEKSKAVKQILNKVSLAPWNQTFLNLQNLGHKCLPSLNSLDESLPLGDFSPQPGVDLLTSSIFSKPNSAGAKSPQDEEEFISGYGGTDYDLRRISLKESEHVLLALGIKQEVIQELDRWDRILVIENKASAKEGSQIMSEKFAHFARNRPTVSHEIKVKQMRMIKDAETKLATLETKQKQFLNNVKPVQDDDDLIAELEMELESKDTDFFNTDPSNAKIKPFGPRRKILRRIAIHRMGYGATERFVAQVTYVRDQRQVEKALDREKMRARSRENGFTDKSSKRRGIKRSLTASGHNSQVYLEKKKEENRRKFTWYQQNVQKFGSNWPYSVQLKDLPDFINHSKLTAEQGKRSKPSRCKLCHLPGHKTNSLNCPLHFATMNKGHAPPKKARKVGATKISFKVPEGVKREKNEKASVATPNSQGDEPRKKVARLLLKRQKSSASREKIRTVKKELGSILCAITDELIKDPMSLPFRQRVSRQDYPSYYAAVKKPIALDLIRTRCNTGEYSSSLVFKSDLQLLLDNCIQFNGVNHQYTKYADALFHNAQSLLQIHETRIRQLEIILNPDMASNTASSVPGSEDQSFMGDTVATDDNFQDSFEATQPQGENLDQYELVGDVSEDVSEEEII